MPPKIPYFPSLWELPSLRMRPSCTATTEAFGALISSTNCGAALAASDPLTASDAAAVGEGAGTEPGTDAAAAFEPLVPAEPAGTALAALAALEPIFALPVTAFAFAVALEADVGSSEPHATCLPVTGKRASTRPVSVAITDLG